MVAKRGAPVIFDAVAFDEDVSRSGERGIRVARAARRDFERDGVPTEALRRCEPEGTDGTELPHCLKGLPAAAGR